MTFQSNYTDHVVRELPEIDDRLRMHLPEEPFEDYPPLVTHQSNAVEVRRRWGMDVSLDRIRSPSHLNMIIDGAYGHYHTPEEFRQIETLEQGTQATSRSHQKFLGMLDAIIRKNQRIYELETQLADVTARMNDLITGSIEMIRENGGCDEGKQLVFDRKGIPRPVESNPHTLSITVEIPQDGRGAGDASFHNLVQDIARNGALTDDIIERFRGQEFRLRGDGSHEPRVRWQEGHTI